MKKEIYKMILQNILQYVDEGIHVIDKEGNSIMYNDTMAKLEGIEKQIILNKKMLDIFPSLNEDTSTLFTVMKTGRPILNKMQTYVNYKGKKINSINTTIPLFIDGMKYGALEIAKDITEIKKMSEQLIDLKQELMGKSKQDSKCIIRKYDFDSIVGNSVEIKKAIDIARKASKTKSSVIIYGETGTGKELIAQSIHYGGSRADKPFIAQNCAALPETLLEGILFGTMKGGFTGATDRPGLFEQANGGTLLLDEINSMDLTLQAKLLRTLQEGYIRRIGGLKDIPIDVRIIATTNEKPLEAVERGKLRKDLYYRLNIISIEVPALRDRIDDIKLLCDFFVRKYNKEMDKDIWMISEEVIALFRKYNWVGNIRELENMIEGAMNYISDDEHILRKIHFPREIEIKNNEKIELYNEVNMDGALPEIVSDIEKIIISRKLKESNYNISKAARNMKISRQTLQYKMKKYNIEE